MELDWLSIGVVLGLVAFVAAVWIFVDDKPDEARDHAPDPGWRDRKAEATSCWEGDGRVPRLHRGRPVGPPDRKIMMTALGRFAPAALPWARARPGGERARGGIVAEDTRR